MKFNKLKVSSNNNVFLISSIPFHLDLEKTAEKFRISPESKEFHTLEDMLEKAQEVGIPKALYRVGYIDKRIEESIFINGTEFKSRVLRVNLEDADRVFLYVITCGMEIEEWSKSYNDPFFAYIVDYIKESVLGCAVSFFFNYIRKTYKLSKFSKMAPGSLKDWPIEQQRQLFDTIGDVEKAAGVILKESFLMVPSKSVSGIIFPTEVSFESCILCPREKCPSRRASYNSTLYNERYSISHS